jgi:hypothetical protein
MRARKPCLLAEESGSRGSEDVTEDGILPLPPCRLTRCGRCNLLVEMRSFAGDMCPDCWADMAGRSVWDGTRLGFMPHPRCRSRAG